MTKLKEALDQLAKGHELDNEQKKLIIEKWQKDLGLQLIRPKGHWILEETGIKITSYYCSECGRCVKDDTGYDVSKDYPFCHCGADMREVES